MTMSGKTIGTALIGLLATSAMLAPVQAQWIDAGGQANLMHQHELMRKQSTREGQERPGADQDRVAAEQAVKARMRSMVEERQRTLRPEYERRVREDGRASADAWLRRVAVQAGREDAQTLRTEFGR